MQRGNAIGKDLGGIIAIAVGDVRWMNKNLSFVAGPCLKKKKKNFKTGSSQQPDFRGGPFCAVF